MKNIESDHKCPTCDEEFMLEDFLPKEIEKCRNCGTEFYTDWDLDLIDDEPRYYWWVLK